MNAAERYAVSFALASIVEVAFILFLNAFSITAPEEEVKGVIRISLIKRQVNLLKREVGEESLKSKEKAKLKSRFQKRAVPAKRVKEGGRGIRAVEGNVPAFFLEEVKEAIKEAVFYPLESAREGESGVVSVRFQLSRDGRVVYCKPEEKRFKYLEAAACIAVERAKFPQFPPSLRNEKLTFIVSIDYSLKSAF